MPPIPAHSVQGRFVQCRAVEYPASIENGRHDIVDSSIEVDIWQSGLVLRKCRAWPQADNVFVWNDVFGRSVTVEKRCCPVHREVLTSWEADVEPAR